MVLKKLFLGACLLLPASCFVVWDGSPSSGFDFMGNLYNLPTLKLANTYSSTINIYRSLGKITVYSGPYDADVDDTIYIVNDWTSTRARARHINKVGLATYINLEISGNNVYCSNFYPFEDQVSSFTKAGILYLQPLY